MWPSEFMASSSLLLLSLAAFLLECHRLGIFTARIFPSQSNSLQLEPRDSSWLGLGRSSWRGQGGSQGSPSSSALKASLSSHPLWRCKHLTPHWARPGGTWASGAVGLGRGERSGEALGTRDSTSVRGEHGRGLTSSSHA